MKMLMIVVVLLVYGLEVVLSFHPIRYYFISSKMTWYEARKYCLEHYHDLATIESMEENNMLPTNQGGGWLGLSDRVHAWRGVMGSVQNSWRWSATGEVNPDGYQNWMSDQPDNVKSQEHCVTMRDGQWADENCEKSFPFVCFTGSTEPGLKGFIYVPTSMTWAAAKNHCRQTYTDLAMIQDDFENTAVASVVSPSTKAWIGLYRVPWAWANGKTSSFFNWAPGQPDNLDGLEQCVWVQENHQWRDELYSVKGPFFCHQVFEVKKYHLKIKLQTDAVLSDPASYDQIIQQLGVKFKNMGLTDFRFTWKTSYPNM